MFRMIDTCGRCMSLCLLTSLAAACAGYVARGQNRKRRNSKFGV